MNIYLKGIEDWACQIQADDNPFYLNEEAYKEWHKGWLTSEKIWLNR